MEGVEAFIVQELSLYREYKQEVVKALDKLWKAEDSFQEKSAMILEWRLSEMDYWLSSLSIYESFVRTLHFIEGRTLAQVAYDYKRAFGGRDANDNAMCRILTRAVEKIRRIVCDECMAGREFSHYY